MRADLVFWLATIIVLVAAGLLFLRQYRRGAPLSTARSATAGRTEKEGNNIFRGMYFGLAGILVGLGWQVWLTRTWPGSTSVSTLAMLAAGTLVVIVVADMGWDRTNPGRERLWVHAWTLFGVSLLLLAAILQAWMPAARPISIPAPQCSACFWQEGPGWLFGLRSLLVSVGLGGWLPALADHVWALRSQRTTPLRPSQEDLRHAPVRAGSMEYPLQGVEGFTRAGDPSEIASKPSAAPNPVLVDPDASPIPTAAKDATFFSEGGLGWNAMRFSYPWLTAAWLVGAVWSLVVYVVPWRGVSPELWLIVSWLLGGIYLCAASVREDAQQETGGGHPLQRGDRLRNPAPMGWSLRPWLLVLLASCGLATAVLAVWQTPLLLRA